MTYGELKKIFDTLLLKDEDEIFINNNIPLNCVTLVYYTIKINDYTFGSKYKVVIK